MYLCDIENVLLEEASEPAEFREILPAAPSYTSSISKQAVLEAFEQAQYSLNLPAGAQFYLFHIKRVLEAQFHKILPAAHRQFYTSSV